MKTTIYYFSGTGNCLTVARDIGRGVANTDVLSIPVCMNAPLKAPEGRIGIVFPVYIWGMPLMVVDFLKKLPIKGGTYIFAVATYGGFVGGSLLQLQRVLQQRGVTLSAGFGIRMPGNYTPLYGAISQKQQNLFFARAKMKIADIIAAVKKDAPAPVESSFFAVNWFFSTFLYRAAAASLLTADKHFWVDERCNRCGICKRICPAHNIELVGGKPVWQHRCQQCMACLQWCPQEAIQYGKVTVARKRYHHPQAKAEDFFIE